MNHTEYPLRHDLVNNSDLYESVSTEMLSIMKRNFLLQRKILTTYDEEHMNNALLLGTVFNTFATGCMDGIKKACEDDMNKILDKILKLQMPNGEWLRRIFASMTPGSSIDVFDAEVQRTYAMIRESGINLEKWDFAIDMHLIPRWDDKYNENMIRSKPKNGVYQFERYISIQVIAPGMRLVLGVLHMPALAETSDYVGMLLAKVINLGIEIGVVMADREFFSVDVIKRFEDMNITYLIPCRNTGVVKGAIEEFAHKKRDRVSDLVLTSTTGKVKYNVIITKRRQRIKGSRRTKTNKFDDIDTFDHDPSEPPHKTYIAFATNDPTINVAEYSRRWGVETGYRQIEFARVRTRSENQEARIFCFMYATMMYNVWVVLNLQDAVFGPKRLKKWDGSPRITQTRMKMRILLYVLESLLLLEDKRKNKDKPLEEKTYLTLEKIPAG